jgi:primosomal protein N'
MKLIKQSPGLIELGFDDQQKAAIAHRGSPLLIQGAAGSGKTTVLIEAALSRINQGASSDSILLLPTVANVHPKFAMQLRSAAALQDTNHLHAHSTR